MKRRIQIALSITGAILIVATLRWAVIRWHNQEMMFERLTLYSLIHARIKENPTIAQAELEGLMIAQWDEIENYVIHPLKLNPRMPNALGVVQYNHTFWENMTLPMHVESLANVRESHLARAGVTNQKNLDDKDAN